MHKMNLDTFLYVRDTELSQYMILNNLNACRKKFNKNILYPYLSELTELNLTLKDLDKNETDLNELHNRNFYKSEINSDTVLVKSLGLTPEYTDIIFDLIEWAKPLIKDLIDEGKILYNFVKRNIHIEEIGEIKSTKNTGYILIPENRTSLLQIFKYEMIYRNGKTPKRTLKTEPVHSIKKSLLEDSPESTIMGLFDLYNDMPKSANYICNTDLDFSFCDTILPVAKRKLLSRMAA